MDIWGGNAWKDDPTTEVLNIPKKELKEVKSAIGFLGGVDDEAGWGDFQDDGWGSQQKKEFGVKNDFASAAVTSPGWEGIANPDSLEHRQETQNEPASPGPASPGPASPGLASPAWVSPASPSELKADGAHVEQESTDSDATILAVVALTAQEGAIHTVEGERLASLDVSIGERDDFAGPLRSSSDSSNADGEKTPDSLRTSVDEFLIGSDPPKRDSLHEPPVFLATIRVGSRSEDDEFGDFEDNTQVDNVLKSVAADTSADTKGHSDHDSVEIDAKKVKAQSSTAGVFAPGARFLVDLSLVNEIFRAPPPSKKSTDAESNLISSTSSRKSWYRLTRPQTLRKFNLGSTDDDYVRISWPVSNVKKEVLKVVSRWASEDRINGKIVLGGKLPEGAAFGWNEPSSRTVSMGKRRSIEEQTTPSAAETTETKPSADYSRKKNATRRQSTTSKVVGEQAPVAQFGWSSPSIASPVAQFGWSSTTVESTLSAQNIPSTTSDQLESLFGAPLVAPQFPKLSNEKLPKHNHGPRAASVNLSPTKLPARTTQRRAAATDVSPTTHSWNYRVSADLENSGLQAVKVKLVVTPGTKGMIIAAPLTALKLDTADRTLNPNPDENEDDEWGEMIQSSPPPSTPLKTPSTLVGQTSLPATPENTMRRVTKPAPIQLSSSSPARHGPDLLSPARRAAFDAARVTRTLSSQHRSISPPRAIENAPDIDDQPLDVTPAPFVSSNPGLTSPITETPKAPPRTVPSPSKDIAAVSGTSLHPRVEASSTTNTLLDADLSIFETTSAPTPAATNTATPTRNTTAPTNKENETIQQILQDYPDLSYMLR